MVYVSLNWKNKAIVYGPRTPILDAAQSPAGEGITANIISSRAPCRLPRVNILIVWFILGSSPRGGQAFRHHALRLEPIHSP